MTTTQLLFACEREPKNAVGTYSGVKDRHLSDNDRENLSLVCRGSPAGIEEHAVSCEITS